MDYNPGISTHVPTDLGGGLLNNQLLTEGHRAVVDWGKYDYAHTPAGLPGQQIVGITYFATTRNEFDARFAAHEDYEPAIPDVTVQLEGLGRTESRTPRTTWSSTSSTVDGRGFAGDVSLSLAGLPAAAGTATFSPPVVTTAGTAQLTVSTASGAANGTYPLTITGTSGPAGHSAFATLVLSPPPDFGLTALPASRTVKAGTAAAYTVTISARNGFTAGVSLALTGLPAAVGTATFTPSVVTAAGTAQLRVTTATGAPGGTYPLTVTATSRSIAHTVGVMLVVVARDFTLRRARPR